MLLAPAQIVAAIRTRPKTEVLINHKTMSSADFVDPAHRLCEVYRKIDHVDQRFRQTRPANVSIDGHSALAFARPSLLLVGCGQRTIGGVDHEHGEKAGRTRPAGILTDAMRGARIFVKALARPIDANRFVADLTADFTR